ncbi:serine/threonine-protein kinase 33 isoform X2 [Gouania willdenowi]|uniref:serine/threonine-protein kinase 33 isoform X2 n=1 Tax=Gouania willdenowi TaxID=441366 RepID=UPI0010566127|nr:serine/threonine-protein kinase 33 isoform X2 [Gouania willdenowi]
MTHVGVSQANMNPVSARSSKDAVEIDVPVIRLKSDAELKEIYEFGKELGRGSFGVVYEATNIETQTTWAIKEVCRPKIGSSKAEMLWQEIHILKQLNHPHVIHLQGVYCTSANIYLVTELCKGGDLKQLLKQRQFLTEDETRNVISSLSDAVVYLHRKGIVHRDLKLENILVKKGVDQDDCQINIKVTDFGLSAQTTGLGIDNRLMDACGTLLYMAPEVMNGHCYSQLCDMWSIGVVMYTLLCGEPPFVSKSKSRLYEIIMRKEILFAPPIWTTVSDAAKNVLTCLLKVDPAYRMSATQLLENPWITGDTDVYVVPPNVMEMMRQQLEQEKGTKSLEVSLDSEEDIMHPSSGPQEVLTKRTSNCSIPPERDRSSQTPHQSITTSRTSQATDSSALSTQRDTPTKRPHQHTHQSRCTLSHTHKPAQPQTH